MNPKKEEYLNFSLLDENSSKRLLSLFDVFVFNDEPSEFFKLVHLDNISKRFHSLFESNYISLIIVPTKSDNLNLNSILKKEEKRPIVKNGFPFWNLFEDQLGVQRYDVDQMLTTDTMLPFPTPQKPFFKGKNQVARNSNQVDDEKVYEAFKGMHFGREVVEWPVSINFHSLSVLNTEPKSSSVLLKVYVPHLNVLFNHSFHQLERWTPLEQVWEILGSAVQMKDFYLFHELQTYPSKREKRFSIQFLELIEPPCTRANSYWAIFKNIFEGKTSVKIRSYEKDDASFLGDLFKKTPFILQSFILVPAIQSLRPELSVENNQIQEEAKKEVIAVEAVQPEVPPKLDENKITPAKQTLDLTEDSFSIKTGKRAFPGLEPDYKPSNSEAHDTPKTQKKVQTNFSAIEVLDVTESPTKKLQIKKNLVYMDLTILFGFLDLFRSFSSLVYAKINQMDSQWYRKLLVDSECEDHDLFKYMYKRYLNEQVYLQSILQTNFGKDSDQLIYPNGNFFYGNTRFDYYFSSISDGMKQNIHKTNPDFSSMKSKIIYELLLFYIQTLRF